MLNVIMVSVVAPNENDQKEHTTLKTALAYYSKAMFLTDRLSRWQEVAAPKPNTASISTCHSDQTFE